MKKNPQRNLFTVVKTERITLNMQRITLENSNVSSFQDDSEGRMIKLLFNKHGDTDLSKIPTDEKPISRTYTIRRFIPEHNLIEVDFVRHITEDLKSGFAARWAISAQEGDKITAAGPGKDSNIDTDANWFFLVADMTALPALSIKLKKLPESAQGFAVIKVISEKDIQPLQSPEGVSIKWITDQSLIDVVRDQPWISSDIIVWCACEFSAMKLLRHYFRDERGVHRSNLYINSYWKKGTTEETHKEIKNKDSKQQGSQYQSK